MLRTTSLTSLKGRMKLCIDQRQWISGLSCIYQYTYDIMTFSEEITPIKVLLFCLIASCCEKTWVHQFSFRFVEESLKKKNSFPKNLSGEDSYCHTWSRRWRSYTSIWPGFRLFKEFMFFLPNLCYIIFCWWSIITSTWYGVIIVHLQ